MKRIALLATGGTIACTPTEAGLAPTLGAEQLLEALAGTLPYDVRCRDVFRMDSSNLQPEEWSELAMQCDAALRDCDGVVVTHGTDTMAYTASALSYMLSGVGKPVILTGSQLPMGAELTDARQNLRHAFAAAASGTPGVYVCFDRKLISGVRAVKTHTTALDAFESINAPLAGYFDAEGLHIARPQPRQGPYRLRAAIDPRVLLLKLIPGTSPDVLRFAREDGYRGLVIEAFGLGGLHYVRRNLVEALRALCEAGVRVVVVSQCLNDKADPTVYEVGRGMLAARIHNGRDMTTEAAVTKLMWALAQPDADALMDACVAGEFRADAE